MYIDLGTTVYTDLQDSRRLAALLSENNPLVRGAKARRRLASPPEKYRFLQLHTYFHDVHGLPELLG